MATLSAKNLSITRGERILYREMTLSFRPEERWAVLGPNGCGKTTLLLTLAGLLSPTAGDITINNQQLTHLSARQLARAVGILFQHMPLHFPQTVYDYVKASRYPYHPPLTLSRHHHEEELLIANTLAALDLSAFADKNIQHLSGGEIRRVAIASLLVQSPSIYLLDEPTNHLDLHHQINALDLFSQQSTVIMTLHDINLAQQYCNRILLLFPDHTFLHGKTTDVLTAEHISRLYQLPMQQIQTGDNIYWAPLRTRLRTSDDKCAIKLASTQ